MNYPKGIQFKSVKPQGFYQEYRDYFVTPVQTYTNQFSIYDIVRIQFNLQDWYIDPYESYIEAEVRLSDESQQNLNTVVDIQGVDNKIQFLMMDGPSTSLINDFRFEVNSKEIERIREYDQVGNLLTDLNMYPDVVDQKDYEGYYSIKGAKTLANNSNTNGMGLVNRPGGDSGTNVGFKQAIQNCDILPQISCFSTTETSDAFYFNQGTLPGVAPLTGTVDLSQLPQCSLINTATTYTGTSGNYYNPYHTLANIGDERIIGTSPKQAYNYYQYLGQLTAGNSNFGIQSASNYSYSPQADTATASQGHIPCMESPKMSQIDGHNIFLTNLPTGKIINGKFIDHLYTADNSPKCTNTRQYMQIPLLSGVMGVLIPQERWQLIPSSSLGQVNMEFRFNPNAFFSHDGQKPNWVVTKFQLRLRMYRFSGPVMDQLRAQVAGGIQLHSQVFSMGPIYNIQPNVSITNNWQLNNGIPSIKQIFFWFLANDFETNWFARKNFKLSQNVTSMQLKVGSTYLPQNPILGHAGNIIMNSFIQQDNSVYLSELHQSMNLLFDCKRHININKLNFSINDRPYDLTFSKMFGTTNWTEKKKGIIKKLGYSMWNEMRCRGKAVYAFNLEMDKKNDDTMSGLDTTKVRPIELILKNDDGNYFPRQSTMYVMFLSDFIVTFGNGETNTEGAG